MELTRNQKLKYLFSLPVIVAALGYFVDIYDLLLFSIVRIPSLQSMGLDWDVYGTMILNWEKTGLLLGGIICFVWFNIGLFFSKYCLRVIASC